MRPLPPLNALRAFEAAARLGSHSRAAEELGVTHGAVSRHIQTLEEFLGTPLFRSHGRGRIPTERAAVYLAEVSAALDRLGSATERMREPATLRTLRVNIVATFAMRWLIPRLSAFQIAHPRVEVRLVTSTEAVEHLQEEFDVVVRRHAMHRAGYASRQFLADPNLPVAAPALLAKYPVLAPGDLLHVPLLHSDSKPNAWLEWFRAAGFTSRDLPTGGQRFENYFFTLEAALRGLGFAVGSLPLVADDLASGRLVAPLKSPVFMSEGYHVLYPANRSNGTVMQFVDWLIAQGATPDAGLNP
jgi:LysR family glycine cleavage system transcriptional activator